MDDQFFMISKLEIARLQAVASRLFTENRMDGDDMRNAAQAIDAVTRACLQMPVPDEDANGKA